MCMASQPAGGQTSTGGAAITGAASGAGMGSMLGPYGAAVGAIGGGVMGVLGSSAANKSAKAVEEARRIESENMIRETRRRATHDYLTQSRLEREMQSQEESAVAMKGADIAKETDRSVATSSASAAERNVAGRTIEDIARDYDFMENEEVGRLKYNQKLANRQHEENIKAGGVEFTNRVADARPYMPKPIAPVDYFGPAFSTLGQVATVKMNYDDQRRAAMKGNA